MVHRGECRTTHHQLPHVLYQPGGEGVQQAVDAQLPDLGQVDQVIALREKAGGYDAEETA